PLVRWSSGSWSTPSTGVDTALTGQGGQRAIQKMSDPYVDMVVERRADGSPSAVVYLNRDAFTAPAPGTYSTDRPGTIQTPSTLTNGLAATRRIRLTEGKAL